MISGTGIVFSKTKQASVIQLISPVGCPLSGCAAGQRLNYRLSFQVTPAFSGENTMICVTSTGGSGDPGMKPLFDFTGGYISARGLISNLPYTERPDCDNINFPDETRIVSVAAQLPSETADQLNLALRINSLADLDGSFKFHLFEKDADGNWAESSSASLQVLVDPLPLPSQPQIGYVAENSNTCSQNSPCFINSGDDLPGGVGTGLKDAIDALLEGTSDNLTKINIISTYSIKSNEVLVNKAHFTLQGISQGRITASGDNCSAPMLGITSPGIIQNLTIDDGNCSNVSRNLLRINSSASVTIQNNTLQNGAHAIVYEDNSGGLLVQFNHIAGNSGYAVRRNGANGSGQLNAVANNILDNAWSTQVDCGNAAKGKVDHNFWGVGISPGAATTNCTYTLGAQLGAPILASGAGVSGELVQVTTAGKNLFGSAVNVKRTAGSDYWLYVVNHGQGSVENVPFLNYGTNPITPCSNHYDMFLASPAPGADLVASFKYNLNGSCQAVIESQSYCGQVSDPTLYPLWWFDPKAQLTDKWDRVGEPPQGEGATGQPGQTVTCDTTNKVITMTLDATGRPNLTNDLNQTPFIVGLPLPEGVQLTEEGFTGTYQINQAELTWTTISENNVGGFHIQRSDNSAGPFYRISGLIDAVGNPFVGGIYTYVDETILFGKTYYYKLEVVDTSDLTIQLFGPVIINSATQTPTKTNTFTPTTTPTKTLTPTITLTPTKTPTRTATPTRTQYYYRSPTSVYRTNTPANVRTATSRFQTPTARTTGTPPVTTGTPSKGTYPIGTGKPKPSELPVNATGTQMTPGTPTPELESTLTPAITATKISSDHGLEKTDRYEKGDWWGIPLGLGIALIGALLAGWFIHRKH
ncbi:MAG: right-handed parallel beta-helix repeat-containing protein [Anaerolineaceae bacterium]